MTYHINAMSRGRIVGDETTKGERYHLCVANATVATVYRSGYAALIKHRLNCHDNLLEACKQVQADIGDRLTGKTVLMLRAAIVLAEKGGA